MLEPHILKLPTPRLLAYYKKNFQGSNPYMDVYGFIADLDVIAYNEFEADRIAIKAELDTREHIK